MQEQLAGQPLTAPPSVFEVGGERFETASAGLADAIAAAHTAGRRPRCMCMVDGIEMYVARLGDGFIVKRMPNTGSQHAPDCPSYEPPPECPGLGQVLGSAITEDPSTGETTLKLDFPLTKIAGRTTMPSQAAVRGSVASDGARLSLRGLLHYLWDQAELTRWHPGFSGKRSWSTVRKHLLRAAANKIARGGALQARLYIPEAFTVDQREAITARRLAQWIHALSAPGKPQQLMLMIAEVKEIVPARYGYKAIVKHVPDQAFALDALLYRRMGRRFEDELALWGSSDSLHMVMIATFGVSEVGIPSIVELSLMTVSAQWLPVESVFELRLLDRLVGETRSFVKSLRYDLPPAQSSFPCAVLIDLDRPPMALCIDLRNTMEEHDVEAERGANSTCGPWGWIWRTMNGALPALPSRAADTRRPAAIDR